MALIVKTEKATERIFKKGYGELILDGKNIEDRNDNFSLIADKNLLEIYKNKRDNEKFRKTLKEILDGVIHNRRPIVRIIKNKYYILINGPEYLIQIYTKNKDEVIKGILEGLKKEEAIIGMRYIFTGADVIELYGNEPVITRVIRTAVKPYSRLEVYNMDGIKEYHVFINGKKDLVITNYEVALDKERYEIIMVADDPKKMVPLLSKYLQERAA